MIGFIIWPLLPVFHCGRTACILLDVIYAFWGFFGQISSTCAMVLRYIREYGVHILIAYQVGTLEGEVSCIMPGCLYIIKFKEKITFSLRVEVRLFLPQP